MIKNQFASAGVAVALMLGGLSVAYAQNVDPTSPGNSYHKFKQPKYRPLTVSKPVPAAAAAGYATGAAVGTALASPLTALGGVGGPIGIAGSVGAGAITGATTLAFAPIAGLSGTAPGISSVGAPPLPIVARYANTGKVSSSYDEGYSQDVPVDASGPIYKINYKESGERSVTPFSVLAFPLTGLTYAITSPLR